MDVESLFLRPPEQGEIRPAGETDHGDVRRLGAFDDCRRDPRQERKPQEQLIMALMSACLMAFYLQLAKMTHEGAARIRNLAPEYAKWGGFVESLGGKPVCVVACFGEYDFAAIVDYPNEVAALKASGYATAMLLEVYRS